MLYEMTYMLYHLPELCECKHHKKVFTERETKTQIYGHDNVLKLITTWNTYRWKCWKCCPINIERIKM